MKVRLLILRWRLKELREKFVMKLAWLLPKQVCYWAFIRMATARYGGNPDDISVSAALKLCDDWAR